MKQDFGIFMETFRPKKLNGLILPTRIKKLFQSEEVSQHWIFHSNGPGLGKTSLSHILSDKYNSIFIDASTDGAIDTLRGVVTNFITSSSLLDDNADKGKVIIFDELDGASPSFFAAFKGFIEKYSNMVKFIATCNNLNKIPGPILSRMTVIPFYPMDETEEIEIKTGIVKRIKAICSAKYLNMNISDDNINLLVDKCFPDMRKMMNSLQYLYSLNLEEITENDIVASKYSYHELFDLCLNTTIKTADIYTEVAKRYSTRCDDIIKSLGDDFIQYLMETENPNLRKISEIINIVNEASYKRNQVIDPMINLIWCMDSINKIIKA